MSALLTVVVPHFKSIQRIKEVNEHGIEREGGGGEREGEREGGWE